MRKMDGKYSGVVSRFLSAFVSVGKVITLPFSCTLELAGFCWDSRVAEVGHRTCFDKRARCPGGVRLKWICFLKEEEEVEAKRWSARDVETITGDAKAILSAGRDGEELRNNNELCIGEKKRLTNSIEF